MFSEFYDSGFWLIIVRDDYFADSICVTGAVTLGYLLLMSFRAVAVQKSATSEERSRAWDIVQAYGCTPLARFTLFDDLSYFFSTGGSVVAYVLEGVAVVTLGDPIGPDTDFFNSIIEFKEFCRRSWRLPVFYQVFPDRLEAYERAGFDALCLGYDAVVDLSTFTLTGSGSKNIRNSFHRLSRLGYRTQVSDPPHSPSLMRELSQVSDEWLSNRGGFEIGFSLGRLEENYLNTSPIILVRDADGRAEAFANLVFEFQANGAVIDLMRYRPDSANGQMDYLLVSMLQWTKELGLSTFNLGFSPFIGIGETPGAPVIERALRFVNEHVNRYPSFKGLHFFKEKFNPVWSPRYLVYPGLISLPIAALGLMRAYRVGRLIGRSLFHRTR